ncbi:septation ring formation regulator EzrA [Lederbergia lenta]|uniref:Septation ring formation regulator EzrA n=1 Tax=Lederbergia lenta TaxID=1467 RepID=A0A2X4WBD7_LEDLE|nr:septation ring formation regulator EzrA [Lederbergia lenta]MCM3111093.1 septation ring formation regulator EzrA [Lederbergia lenta]MEC2325519.1 septation ring formation regulator EzrA [Lederbergia lenta]SQI54920.1 Septation ring formation regulator EzrA [Lederbergia lenta]
MKYGVEIVIVAIVFLLIVFAVGYIYRKRYYKEIDRLEARKLELMHRPVIEELGSVKRLNMTGETEKLFEGWRKSWDDIVTVKLPNIDEMLFDAEEYTDKYRFNKAKETHEKIEALAEDIEEQINIILEEVSELVGSEEKNRTEMEQILGQYQHLKKSLLAHRHTYGIAAERLDELLNSAAEKIASYEELTKQGDYLIARELVLTLSNELIQLKEKMEKIPDLLTECQTVIPAQKNDLADGYREMLQQGFILEHLQLEKELQKINTQLEAYKEFLKNAEVDEVENGLEEMKDKIELFYDMLEKEVYEKHYVVKENEKISYILDQLKEVNSEIAAETDTVKNSYQLLNNDLDIPYTLEKGLDEMIKRYELLNAKISEETSAYSLLSEELKGIEKQISVMKDEQNEFTERLQSLRKDELDARESLKSLQKQINEIIRMVQKSRMPGLPSDFESLYDQAEEQIEDVYKSLNEKPLNMSSVQKYLTDARDTVDHLHTRTVEHIENAHFAEKVIQYGNRYRTRNQELRSSLDQAEQAFRNYEYKSALEQAATAVEAVEPGALKRIEELLDEDK